MKVLHIKRRESILIRNYILSKNIFSSEIKSIFHQLQNNDCQIQLMSQFEN